jgi:hypothetical protein
MNRFFTLLFAASCFTAVGQVTYPYNPDENGDMLIGVVDLQALLANYGQEFSSAVVSEDGESAIVFIGEMAYPICAQACKNLPGIWEVPKIEDLGLVWDEVYTSNSNVYTWLSAPQSAEEGNVYVFKSENVSLGNDNAHRVISTPSPIWSWQCYCAARQLPRVEYFTCKASCSDGYIALDDCVNEKLAEGWYPLQSQRQQQVYNDCFWQPLWRWAE